MKNCFYFNLKALFVLKIFNFLSWVFGHVEKMAWLRKNHLENEAGRLFPDLILFLEKALFEVNASGLQLGFNILR